MFFCSAVLTFPAADWTRSGQSKPTWLTFLFCVFVQVRVADTTEQRFNLSTVKSTAQRRLRSHTCASRDLKAPAQVSSCFYYVHLIPVLLLLFSNVWLYCSGICIHSGGTSSRVNIGLAFWKLHILSHTAIFFTFIKKKFFLICFKIHKNYIL